MFGGFRLRGGAEYTTGASGLKSSHFKIEVEAPFTQVRVWVGNRYKSGTLGTWKAIVGVTDTMAIDTVDHAFTPMRNGVADNTLSATGWTNVTWDAGAASKDAALAFDDGGGTSNTYSFMHSDWMNVASIPRTDTPGARPAIVMRAGVVNSGGQITQGLTANTLYYGARGGGFGWYREYLAQTTANDAMGTLSNKPASVSATGGFESCAWLEFKYTTRVRSLLVLGDSQTECQGALYGLNNAFYAAVAELSTQAAPISVVTLAASSLSQADYMTFLDQVLALGDSVTDVFIQGFSGNGYDSTDAGATAMIARMLSYITLCRGRGIKVFMGTGNARFYTGAGEIGRVKVVNQIKTWATAGLVVLVDTDSVLTDYSGGNGILFAAFDSGDHIHANVAGMDAEKAVMKAAWS